MAWGRGQRSTRIRDQIFLGAISQVKCQPFLILLAVHIISVWCYMYLTPRDLSMKLPHHKSLREIVF